MAKKYLSKEYSLLVPILLNSYHLKEKVKTDADRRALIMAKYNLSKHPLYCLLKDYVNDPYNSRWYYSDNVWWYGDVTEQYDLVDRNTGFSLKVKYHGNLENKKMERDKHGFDETLIKVKMTHGRTEMNDLEIFTANQMHYIMKIFSDVKTMKEINDDIIRQQNNYKFITRMKNVY